MKKLTVNLGQTYSLDLGSSRPIVVIPLEYLENGNVLVEYQQSWPGRTEEFSYEIFGSNYGPPK